MTLAHFSSVSTNFLTFEPTYQKFLASVNVVQGYVSCVSRYQSAVEELEEMLFCSRHQLPHCLPCSMKSNSRLKSPADIFSVLLHGHVLPFLESIILFCVSARTRSCTYIDILMESSRFPELRCLEQLKKKR